MIDRSLFRLARRSRRGTSLRLLLPLVFSLKVMLGAVLGYTVGPALSLDKLEAEAELVFKGEAVASETVEDPWFKPVPGYLVRETRFKLVSAIKGPAEGGEIRFRHYEFKDPKDRMWGVGRGMSTPSQEYHFEPGRSYIVFASKTATGARQTRLFITGRSDLGVLRCRSNSAVTAKKLPEIFWAEILALRDSPERADVLYAMRQWDGMSDKAEQFGDGHDFSRLEVLNAVLPLIRRPEPEIAQAAIRMIGDGSPYLSDHTAPFWLGTVGVPMPGLGQMDPGTRNAGGALCWRELVEVANHAGAAPETRALAIRALGLVKARDIRLDPWVKSPLVPVRAAGVLLAADYMSPNPYTTEVFTGYAADPAADVRKCAAYTIGFMQNPALVPLLGKLLHDDDASVRRAAAESLHSFSPKVPEAAAALRANLKNPESQPLSLLALARENPGEHLEALVRVIEEKTSPTNSSGGQIPAFTAWKLLFKHLRAQPPADLRAGKWDRYLDGLEKVGQYSSSEPRDIYAFYLQMGLKERAVKYRAQAKQAVSYDLDYFFDMVDQNPAQYTGN